MFSYFLYLSALRYLANTHFRYDPYCKYFIKRGPRGSKGRGIQCQLCRIGAGIDDVPVRPYVR